jgi:D-alanyl-D-alanine carboxypeptidase
MATRHFGPSSAIGIVAIIAAAASSLAAAVSSQAAVQQSLSARVDKIVESGRRELDLPGVSLVIMRGDKLLLAKGYGWADLDGRRPAEATTIYPVGSLSKQFTAAAVMTLVERHRVNLDAPVTSYLPEYRPLDASPPTIRQLLEQTTGVPTWDDLPEFQDESDASKFALSNIATALANLPTAYRAGDWWSYSNSNYTLLARVIERVTSTRYDDYMARTFFGPLGLTSTSGCLSRPAKPSALATGYNHVDGKFLLRPFRPTNMIGMAGAGGLCSNGLDLVRWERLLVSGRVVSSASFAQMTAPTKVRAGFTAPYGFGLSLLPFDGRRAVWHTGVMAGYISVLAYLPDQDVTIAALTNSRHVQLHSVVKRVVAEVIGLKLPEIADRPIPPAEIARTVGKYDDHMFKFEVYSKGPQLFVTFDQLGGPLRLQYQGGHDYATVEPTGYRFHFGPADGPVKRVDWEWTELRAFAEPVHQ